MAPVFAALHARLAPLPWPARAAAAVWLATTLVASALANPGPPNRLHLDQAEFMAEGQTAPLAVVLPDTWAQRGQPVGGVGHYRLHFSLAQPVEAVWALRADRLSTAHEVRLNGHLVHGSLLTAPQARRPLQALIPLPPNLLLVGPNQLDIAIATGINAGLSPLELGPSIELAADFQRQQQRTVGLPQLLNVAGAGVSLFMLLLWSRRRSETVLGSFGALGLLASLRNAAYFENGTVLPPLWAGGLYLLAQMLTVLLLGAFAMGFAGRKPRAYVRALWALALLFPVFTLWAVWADALQGARRWLYPVLLALALPALFLVAQAAWRKRTSSDAALAALVASLAGALAAGVHDFLYQLGHLSVMGQLWLPYAVPLLLAAFSALLLKRLLQALASAERVNATLERRVQERTRELQAANAAKTRFLAAASHDLRQPMVSIGLLVGLLSEQVAGGPLQRVVQRLQESARAMETLLTRLLDLSRLQAGAVRLQRQPLALQALLEEAAAQHAEQALRQGLQLRLRVSPAVVDSDPVLLAHIVGNLVGNAVRYTREGGVLLGVRTAGPLHWRVAVWDTGPGIAPDQQARIFGEFVRGDTPAAAEESATGLGLGLAIVERSAALLGTAVVLRSRPGRGSCFSVRLPRASAVHTAASPTPADNAPAAPAAPATPMAGRRVWLLEDNPNARASLHLLLQHWGAEVQSFATVAALQDAHTALPEPATHMAPHLLLTDLRLPDGQGTDALLQLRMRWPHLPAVIVTGNTAPDDLAALEQWREAGIQVLLKPFATAALHAALQAALQSAMNATVTSHH